jgi:peptidoglycan/LPS O-acetylase OafA/YrhL
MIPVIFYLSEKFKTKWKGNIVLLSFAALSIIFYSYIKTIDGESMIRKLSAVIVIPYLFNFITGILIYRNWSVLQKWLVNKALYWFFIYIGYVLVFAYLLHYYSPEYWPNFFGLIANILLSFLVIATAFTAINFSERFLKGFDISYGVYIYHMLVVNTLAHLSLKGEMYQVLLTILITYILATLSWTLVERRALARKTTTIHKPVTSKH